MTKTKKFLAKEGVKVRIATSTWLTVVATALGIITAMMMHKVAENEKANSALYNTLESVMDFSKTSLLAVDNTTHTIVQVNEQFMSLTGYSRKEVLGKSLLSLIPMEYRSIHTESYSQKLSDLTKTPEPFEGLIECDVLCKGGTKKRVIIRIFMNGTSFALGMVTPVSEVSITHIPPMNPPVEELAERELQVTPSDVLKSVTGQLDEIVVRLSKLERELEALRRHSNF